MSALNAEMKKEKPRDPLLLPLMKSTYAVRRSFIQNEDQSVLDILERYEALSRPAVVSH